MIKGIPQHHWAKKAEKRRAVWLAKAKEHRQAEAMERERVESFRGRSDMVAAVLGGSSEVGASHHQCLAEMYERCASQPRGYREIAALSAT